MNTIEQPSVHLFVPLLRGSEEQAIKLRKRLVEVHKNVSLAHDVIAVCVELCESSSGDFNREIAHILRRCAADRLQFQLEALTKVISRLGAMHAPYAAPAGTTERTNA